jgi:serine/threonine-protein kinase
VGDLRTQLETALADRYAIERELGRGGMATVFLATDLRHERPVALKVLHRELAASLGSERFQREIRLCARLQHPHILTVHDSGEIPGPAGTVPLLWFTMPFIEGESLRDRLNRERQLPVEDALRIAAEAADALDYAHRHGVLHRDIKPENILLSEGHALVADFGIGKALGGERGQQLTETGLAMGTPAYMSPEQAAGEKELDARSDLYSLATVLYEMLAGETPFAAPTVQATIARRFTDVPRPLRELRQSVPEGVAQAVQRALARTAADRFASVSQFAQALRIPAGLTGQAPSAPAPSVIPPVASIPPAAAAGARRRKFPIAATALGLGFLLGLGVLFAWRRSHPGAAGEGPGAGPRLLAVLPFENLGAPEDDYFADGITDEIRGKLATLPGLQVIASSSASQYKHTTKTPRQIAQELGVQYLLTGKIRWEKVPGGGASRVRVSPELIQVATGSAPTTRWQQPFDAGLTDVFQVQADIAGRVAGALNLALADSAQRTLAVRPTADLAAYDAYLKGVEFYAQGPNPLTARQALSQFEQAVALDTAFAAAWARLSQAASLLNATTTPSSDLVRQSLAAAQRALSLAPTRPEGYLALGDYYRRTSDYAQAMQAYSKGQQLAPSDADLLRGIGLAEQSLGQWDEALGHLQQSQRLDPRNGPTATTLTIALHYLRRYSEALQAADRALALGPANLQNFENKVMVLLSEGDLAGARALMAHPPKGVEPTVFVAYVAAYYDLFWLLNDEQQALLLRLGPGPFDDDRGAWGLALAGTCTQRGDRARAHAYADSARIAFETQLRDAPDDAGLHTYLGTALAYLGRKGEAIAEGQKGVALMPVTKNTAGAYFQHQLARIYLMVGEPEKALDLLEPLLKMPYYLSPGWLQIDPTFAPLKGNPRFRKLVEG